MLRHVLNVYVEGGLLACTVNVHGTEGIEGTEQEKERVCTLLCAVCSVQQCTNVLYTIVNTYILGKGNITCGV